MICGESRRLPFVLNTAVFIYSVNLQFICRESGRGFFPGHAQAADIPVALPPGAAPFDSARAIHPIRPRSGEFPF